MLVIAVSIITLASISTYVTAQENTTAANKSMGFDANKSMGFGRFMAAGDNKYVEIENNLSRTINLKGWTLVVNDIQIPLP